MEIVSILGDGKLSANLTKQEVRKASHKDANYISADLPFLFELVRTYSGDMPIKVYSAFRDHVPVGGVQHSAHMKGQAFDLHMDKTQLSTFIANLNEFMPVATVNGLGGIGFYSWGLHIDTDTENISKYWRVPGGGAYPLRYWSQTGKHLLYYQPYNQQVIAGYWVDDGYRERSYDESFQTSDFLTLGLVVLTSFFIYKILF